jgi:hypothetical protein
VLFAPSSRSFGASIQISLASSLGVPQALR